METRRLLAAAVLVLLTAVSAPADQLAFPGAEGFGRFARGGRGGAVLFVTNLNDSGPGSLRAAVETEGPRTVVFAVSGTIRLKSELRVEEPRITIAGQTAPGDGICLRDYPLRIFADDVVVRYLRVRLGDTAGRLMDGIEVRRSENVIIDHCSVSWTLDESVNTYHGSKNLTLQWCLIAESLDDSRLRQGHGFAASIGGVNTSYHHNLFVHHAGRNPSIAGGGDETPTINLDFRNNVIFNWRQRALDGRPHSINVVNNYYKAGPATRTGPHIVKVQSLHDGTYGRWHVSGNVLEDRTQNQRRENLVKVDKGGAALDAVLVSEPAAAAPVRTQPAAEAYEAVLRGAGATRPRRDPLDVRLVAEVRSGQPAFGDGIISSQTDVGGWPELRSDEPPGDADADGMPDAWERRFSAQGDLSLQGHSDLDADGYTNLEEYLNRTAPTRRD